MPVGATAAYRHTLQLQDGINGLFVTMVRKIKSDQIFEFPSVKPGSITIKGQEFKRGFGAAFVGGTDEKGTFKIASREKGVFKLDLDYTRDRSGDDIRPNGTKSEHSDKELWELVDKDTLRICRAPGKDRPDSFETKKGDGREVKEYTRAKEKK